MVTLHQFLYTTTIENKGTLPTVASGSSDSFPRVEVVGDIMYSCNCVQWVDDPLPGFGRTYD